MFKVKEGISIGNKVITGAGPTEVLTSADVGTMAFQEAETFATPNLEGGNSSTLLGSMPYQSDVDTTTMISPNVTTTPKYLSQTGTGTNGAVPAWVAPSTLTIGNGLSGTSYNTNAPITIAVSAAENATNASYYPVFATTQGTAVVLGTDAGWTLNPSTSNMTIAGDLTVSGGDVTAGNIASNLFAGNTTTNSTGWSGLTSGTLIIGGTAATGAMTFGQSTGAQTLNIGTGATLTATTKTINIGTAGVSGSTTTIGIGSAVTGSTTSINFNSAGKLMASVTSTGLFVDDAIMSQRSGVAGQSVTIYGGGSTSTSTYVTGRSLTTNAKPLLINSTTDAVDTIPTVGFAGLYLQTMSVTRMTIINEYTNFTPGVRNNTSQVYFQITTPPDTNLPASVEAIGVNKTAASRQFATGALALQREIVLAAPTYTAVGASTITTAVNLEVADPIAGTNATITNKWGIRANNVQLLGNLSLSGIADLGTAASHYFVESASDSIVRPKTLALVQAEIVTSTVLGSGTANATTVLLGNRTWGSTASFGIEMAIALG